MNLNSEYTTVRRVRDGQRGQALVLVMVLLVAFLGASALVVNLGALYYSYQELQAATQAAALAGAQYLPNSSGATVIAKATQYSAVTGGLNTHSNLLNVAMVSGYPLLKCFTSTGVSCSTPSGYNGIVVKQQATVPMYFAKVFGVSSVAVTATATAGAPGPGGRNGPYNVMMVLDTTASMSNNDNNCGDTRINCALAGVRTLLGTLSPCAANLANCGAVTNFNVPNPVDEVGLTVFPGLSSATYAQYDYDCSNNVPNNFISKYTASPLPTYQIVPFSSDYRTSDTAGSLNATSDIVLAARGVAGCNEGVDVVGGVGTFYAGAITVAQTALQNNARPNSTNVLIFLSDGDANATNANLVGYPSTQECHQAITAAQAAAGAGTWVYSIAYGAALSGCGTDTAPAITTCAAMQQIASSPGHIPDGSKFFSVAGGVSCPGARSTASLNQIFTAIGGDLTLARLLPNNTT